MKGLPRGRSARLGALAIILAIAAAWRLYNIGFGLPSLYDPDEPIFMIKALEMLTDGSANPGWFGHPGSTTIYLLALIDVIVVGWGLLTGTYANVDAFAHAAFANPGLLFLPSRIVMAGLGVAAVSLTYLVGRRLHGTAAGLLAALFLALNALHIAWSQVVRTDIHASVFMCGCLLFAIRAAMDRKARDFILAGAFAGFAIATKWPAASVFVSVLGAAAYRARLSRNVAAELRNIGLASAALLVGVFLASPFIFLDWQTVLANVAGEVKGRHLGHTGDGLLPNLWWYLWHPVRESIGLAGLVLILAGCVVSAVRSAIARYTLVPATLLFVGLISSQNLIWSRWILPALPAFMIFAAVAIVTIAEAVARKMKFRKPALLAAVLSGVVLVPSSAAAVAQAKERSNDTRQQAARWATDHIPSGSSVVLEHVELSLRDRPWQILFPIGGAGCVDAVALLSDGVRYEQVESLRAGSPIVDLGNVARSKIESCNADYAILTYYDAYLSEATSFPRELANYRALLRTGRTVALFIPLAGKAGGPVVRIVALPQHER